MENHHGAFDWIDPQLKFVDICIDMMEEYRKNWRDGEEDSKPIIRLEELPKMILYGVYIQ